MRTQGPQDGAADLLRVALTDCAAAGLSGVLHVTGNPGGTIYLADGGVAAIQTPGAPNAEVILLRSRFVSESGWDAAFAAAAGGPMCAELIARAVVGMGELEALLRITLADAMFALASGFVAECRAEPGAVDYLLPLEPGAEAGPLLAEASRRMRVLASLPHPDGLDRERFVVVPGAVRPDVMPGQGQDEILALADGRRTSRDMAFALGRGVYATRLQLAQMRDAGVVATSLPGAVPAGGSPPQGRRPAVTDKPETEAGLPLRRKGRPVQPRRTGEPRPAADQSAPYRLLRPRSGRNADPGEMT